MDGSCRRGRRYIYDAVDLRYEFPLKCVVYWSVFFVLHLSLCFVILRALQCCMALLDDIYDSMTLQIMQLIDSFYCFLDYPRVTHALSIASIVYHPQVLPPTPIRPNI